MPAIQETVRREIAREMSDRARSGDMELEADTLAIASAPRLSVVNAPVAGLDQLDPGPLLDGGGLEDKPVMCWYLSGEALDADSIVLHEGFHTVVPERGRGTVALVDDRGKRVAQGDLDVCVEPPGDATEAVARTKVTGGIDSASADLWPPRVKICGHVKVTKNGVTVTIRACITAGF